MWTDPDEARSDFVLAAATALFGPLVIQLVYRYTPLGPFGLFGTLLSIALLFVITGLVPILLARYRGNGIAAFGLQGGREGIGPGVLIALPVVLLGIVVGWTAGFSPLRALAGIVPAFLSGPFGGIDVVLAVLAISVQFAGMVLLYSFLAVKAREGFGRTEIGHLEVLRTYGLAAAGGALLIGLLAAIGADVTVNRALLDAAALVAVILVADRFTDMESQTTRLAVAAPAIVALLLAWDLFGGQFLATLRHGLLAAGAVIVVTVLVDGRSYAWAIVPLFAALTIYRTALTPL